MLRLMLTAVVFGLLVGCDASSGLGDGSSDEKVNPRTEASQTDEYVQEALGKDKVSARQWLSEVNHLPFGKPKDEVLKASDDFLAAGAKGVYVIGIEPTAAGQRAGGLLIELPEELDARRTVFWHLAKVPGQKPGTPADHGQPYHTLSLP